MLTLIFNLSHEIEIRGALSYWNQVSRIPAWEQGAGRLQEDMEFPNAKFLLNRVLSSVERKGCQMARKKYQTLKIHFIVF